MVIYKIVIQLTLLCFIFQKYSIITFLPLVLYQQFKFFLNLYFLVMALSQFIPDIRIGYLYTYWGPLCFVLSITLFREAVDDVRRYRFVQFLYYFYLVFVYIFFYFYPFFRRDRNMNSELYERIILHGEKRGCKEYVPASSLRVGDILILKRSQRVPADLLLLHANDPTGSVFVATDQLDGETNWKVRYFNYRLVNRLKNFKLHIEIYYFKELQ